MSSSRAPEGILFLGIRFIGVFYLCLRLIVKNRRHPTDRCAEAARRAAYLQLAARLSLPRIQPVEEALQLFKLLPSFAELAFRRQTLVVGKVFGGFRDECVQIRCGLGRCA
jgi:hypothetical protein